MPSREHSHALRRGTDVSELPGGDSAALAALLDSVDCGVLLFGAHGELRAANDRFAEMLHIAPARLRELVNFDLVAGQLARQFSDPESVAARWRERFRAGCECSDELELVRPEHKILERFARPVGGGPGEKLGWIEIYRDISSQRSIEAKRFHTDRMAALGFLVSGIAHELNNPLTSILGYAQLMLRRRRQPERDADVQRILSEVARASRIARNLLLFARESEAERARVSLNDIVERALALRRHDLRQHKITVQVSLEPNLPPTLADGTQLQQILLNLLVNAEQAIYLQARQQQTARGRRGRIWVRTRRVSAQRVAMEVIDDGPGIAPEIAPRIFDPFFTTKPPGIGTGLGLSIVFSIVQEHDGHVSVENMPHGGAAFRVELPIAGVLESLTGDSEAANNLPWASTELAYNSPEEVVSAILPLRDVRDAACEGRKRVLVVEDEPTVARLIADVLDQEGYVVRTVLDSREGLALICTEAYDLVICDLRMPHLDGRGFYDELARQHHPLQQRMVFVTGNSLTTQTSEFLRQSGGAYLAKPFLVDELKQTVIQALAVAGQRESALSRVPPLLRSIEKPLKRPKRALQRAGSRSPGKA